jgi:hypothetical protein
MIADRVTVRQRDPPSHQVWAGRSAQIAISVSAAAQSTHAAGSPGTIPLIEWQKESAWLSARSADAFCVGVAEAGRPAVLAAVLARAEPRQRDSVAAALQRRGEANGVARFRRLCLEAESPYKIPVAHVAGPVPWKTGGVS